VQNDGTRVLLTLRNKDTGVEQTEVYDGVVLATGYNRNGHEQLLSPMARWMSEQGVERCYRLPMAKGCHANVFLQGCCEQTHGLSDTLLSILAVRSQEVVDALIERQSRPIATACAS
jgi:Lysine/ornithine N-monooxygenase